MSAVGGEEGVGSSGGVAFDVGCGECGVLAAEHDPVHRHPQDHPGELLGGEQRVVQAQHAPLSEALQGGGEGGQTAFEASLPVGAPQLGEAASLTDHESPQPQDLRMADGGDEPAADLGQVLLQVVGVGSESVAVWTSVLVYDAMIVGDFSLPTGRVASVEVPRLVLDGGQTPWLSTATRAVVDALPNARRHTLEGQPHNVDAAALAPPLVEFFSD
jgi:hypothetical protein